MRRLLPILLLVLLAPASQARAQDCIAPPGTAAVDEYCETVPEATGERGSPAPPRNVSPSTLAALRAQGEDGARLADQLDRAVLAKDPNRRRDRDAPVAKGDVASRMDSSEPGSNPLDAIREAVGTGARVEAGLGWALALITLALGGVWWLGTRRRRA
jgi:hypothetical protein